MAKGSIFGRKKNSATPSASSSKKSSISVASLPNSIKKSNHESKTSIVSARREQSIASSRAGQTGCGPRLCGGPGCGPNKNPTGVIKSSGSVSSLGSAAILEVYQESSFDFRSSLDLGWLSLNSTEGIDGHGWTGATSTSIWTDWNIQRDCFTRKWNWRRW